MNQNQVVDLTIVIPCYNEGSNIESTINDLQTAFSKKNISYTILVVDDGSESATKKILQSLEQKTNHLQIVTHPSNLGLGRALKTGFCKATTEWMTWTPSDGQIAANDVIQLFEIRGANHAVKGSIQSSKRASSDGFIRLILSKGSRFIMWLLHPSIPSFNGIMVVRRDAFTASALVCKTGFVNMEILDRIRRRHTNAKFEERAIGLLPRISGSSKVANMKTIVAVILDLLKMRLNYWFGFFS